MGKATIERVDHGLLRVYGDLDFHSVPGLYAGSRDLFSSGPDLKVDLGGVEKADSAGLVLLLEWLSEARERETGLAFVNIPESLLEIARVSNLYPLLRRVSSDQPS
jgi:phospholipid transport system transporter-binding protein